MELERVGELYNETKEKIRLIVNEANKELYEGECDSVCLEFKWTFDLDVLTEV